MSETERKTEENESSSDEEPPPGELDKPIVILYNKRAKKVRYNLTLWKKIQVLHFEIPMRPKKI